MKPPCSTYARKILPLLARQLQRLLATEEQHRGFQQILDGGGFQIDGLPGQFPHPFLLDRACQVRHATGMQIPVCTSPCLALAITTGRRPLDRNSSAKEVATSGLLSPCPTPLQ